MLMVPVLEEFAIQNHDVLVAKISATGEKELCEQWNVKVFPTLLLFKDNKEMNRHEGPLSLDELPQFLDQLPVYEPDVETR